MTGQRAPRDRKRQREPELDPHLEPGPAASAGPHSQNVFRRLPLDVTDHAVVLSDEGSLGRGFTEDEEVLEPHDKQLFL